MLCHLRVNQTLRLCCRVQWTAGKRKLINLHHVQNIKKRSSWDDPLLEQTFNRLLAAAVDPSSKAHLLTKNPEPGLVFYQLPIFVQNWTLLGCQYHGAHMCLWIECQLIRLPWCQLPQQKWWKDSHVLQFCG